MTIFRNLNHAKKVTLKKIQDNRGHTLLHENLAIHLLTRIKSGGT